MKKSLILPVASFALALLLSLISGPGRVAFSRQAAGNSGCQPSCSVTKSPAADPDDPPPEAVAIAVPRRPADFRGSGEFVNVVNANTGPVGSVTVNVEGWKAEIQSTPGSSGGGGSTLKGTLSLGSFTRTVQRVIIYGAGNLPGEITITGAGSVSVSGLETCAAVSGNITWNVGALAAYFGPNGAKRSVVSHASATGWNCSAQ